MRDAAKVLAACAALAAAAGPHSAGGMAGFGGTR